MYNLLVRLMLIAGLAQFGSTLLDLKNCNSRACIVKLEKLSRDVLRIDWKPISVFPYEAKRFR